LEKSQFYNLLLNYTALTRAEAQELILLENEFPYSQVIHGLAARATQDNQLPEKEDQLHLGAIYTTDRTIFKSVMTASIQERKNYQLKDLVSDHVAMESDLETIQVIETLTSQHTIESLPDEVPLNYSNNIVINEAFYEEIQHDIERLKELKHEFEETVRQLEDGALHPPLDDGSASKKKKSADLTEEFLTEIKSSKKKIKPEGTKQKEQIEIIDHFIKTQPTIKGMVGAEAAHKNDLSENSLIYNENIISETLAEILIKQGKKEKAIEVLKKLIWKFPQKKAYFAAQIEDLKK
jgi:hypothetical protein